jgi:UDP-N-acetylglucosamine 2-epimerase
MLFPVVLALAARGSLETLSCVTAQHCEMLDQVLNIAEEDTYITRNTVLDALLISADKIIQTSDLPPNLVKLYDKFSDREIFGVTSPRRENLGDGLTNIASALRAISERDDVALIFPVHLQPNGIKIVEPYASELPAAFVGTGAELIDIDQALETCPVMITLTDHDIFKSIPLDERAGKIVYDTRRIWPDQPDNREAASGLRLAG